MTGMSNYCIDMDIDISWPLRDPDHFSKLDVTGKSAAHWKLQTSDLNENYLAWLDQHNLIAAWPEMFYCAPHGNIFLHMDEIHPPNGVKMNWVYDQGETWMRWFELKSGKEIVKQDNTIGGIYYTCRDGDSEFVYQHRIQKPTLVNAGVLHDVINPTDYPRWCVSVVMQFKDKPESRLVWDEAMNLFSPYFQS